MRTLAVLLVLGTSLYLGACGGESVDDKTSGDRAHLKTVVRAEAFANGGKDDKGRDFCAIYEFYNDGRCDSWCPQLDMDCDNCDIPKDSCWIGEKWTDTTGSGCEDSCLPDPDYQPPIILELGAECSGTEECEDDAYCAKEDGKCEELERGVCTKRPECEPEFEPDYACGCVGVTFGRPCDAYSLGYNIRHEGFCDNQGNEE